MLTRTTLEEDFFVIEAKLKRNPDDADLLKRWSEVRAQMAALDRRQAVEDRSTRSAVTGY